MSWIWHSFADMSVAGADELVLARGEGSWVWDVEGRRYLDAIASLWYCNIGHGRAEVAAAAARQMEVLEAFQTFGSFANPPAVELAARLRSLAPIPDAAVFFTNGGSDAVDTAAKLVRRYWNAVGSPERQTIVAHERAYHGMNAFGTSLAGLEVWSEGYGQLVPGVVRIPYGNPDAFRALLRKKGREVAAFVGEPVLGGGGVYPPPDGYWDEIGSLCREYDVLLVADEVITGFGRLGTWFASERFGIEPDIIICAKGITSGYLPLGAVLCGARVREPFWTGGAIFQHGYTYAGHPTACAVALANLSILEAENLVPTVRELEPIFAAALRGLADHTLVDAVRSIGLMGGVELSADAVAADPTLPQRVVRAAQESGLILRAISGRVLQISPPFIITPEEIDFIVKGIDNALAESHALIA